MQNASKTHQRHHGELVEIMSRFKVRTALRELQLEASTVHTSPFCGMERNATGLSAPHGENM